MLSIESRPEALNHPDVQRGLVRPKQEQKQNKDHKKNFIKAVSIGLAGTIAAAGVYIGSSRLFGPESGGDHGVAPVTTSDTLNPTPTPTPTETELIPAATICNTEAPTPTPEPTPTPTPEPTPTPTPALSPEQQEDLVMQEKLALAPEIEGLSKQIKEVNGLKRVVYIAESGNRFGIEVGAYAGEYKKEVTFEDKEVGAVALIAKAAEEILTEEIAKQPDGEKWLIVLPADIADLKTTSHTTIDISCRPFLSGPYAIRTYFDQIESVDVLNTINKKVVINKGISQANGYTINCSSFNENSKQIVSDREMEFLITFAKYISDPLKGSGETYIFGQSFGQTISSVLISMNNFVGGDGLITQSFDKVLKINEVPVFLTNNSPKLK